MFNDSDQNKLDTLAKRIGKARESLDPASGKEQDKAGPMDRGIVRAVKLGSDFVATIFGMAFFGWLVDRYLETAPWIMLLMISMGFVAGFWMLIRALVLKPAAEPEDQDPQDEAKK